jgi:hypothetical protein
MLTCTVSVHHPVPARYTRYVSIFLESIFFLSFFLNVRTRSRWAKIESRTKLSLRRGRSQKRIGQNTRLNPGPANIAGFDPPTLCAWSNTGAGRDPSQHSRYKPQPLRRLLLAGQGSAAPSPICGRLGHRANGRTTSAQLQATKDIRRVAVILKSVAVSITHSRSLMPGDCCGGTRNDSCALRCPTRSALWSLTH